MSLTNHLLDVSSRVETVGNILHCDHDTCPLFDGERVVVLAEGNDALMVFDQDCVIECFGTLTDFGNHYEDGKLTPYLGTFESGDEMLSNLVAL